METAAHPCQLSQCYGPSTGALDVANTLAERGGFEPPEP